MKNHHLGEYVLTFVYYFSKHLKQIQDEIETYPFWKGVIR